VCRAEFHAPRKGDVRRSNPLQLAIHSHERPWHFARERMSEGLVLRIAKERAHFRMREHRRQLCAPEARVQWHGGRTQELRRVKHAHKIGGRRQQEPDSIAAPHAQSHEALRGFFRLAGELPEGERTARSADQR